MPIECPAPLWARGAVALAVLMAVCAPADAGSAAQEPADSPPITTALRRFAEDRRDIEARYARQDYERIPRERKDLNRDAALLDVAVAHEDAELRSRVTQGLQAISHAFDQVTSACVTRDDATISRALAALDTALANLTALFPASLRP
jgi:hypothetical protein